MSFLAPLWMLLGVAAAVPLLVHLLRRRTGTRVEFPAARYLARAERDHSRSLRVRNLLLMLLRVLVVLLLAAAAARPVGRLLGATGAGHPPTALALMIDNSLSTTVVRDGRPLLETFREAARRVVADASPADRVWIVTADGAVRGGTRAAALAALDRLAPLGGAGDLPAALATAAATARRASELAPRVAVLTDGQASAWRDVADVAGIPEVLLHVPGGAVPRNATVGSLAASPARWTPRGRVAFRLLGRDSSTYRVTIRHRGAERTIARGVAILGQPVVVPVSSGDTGWFAGSVEIDRDELPGDDLRWFSGWSGPAPAVEVAPEAGPFVRSAVEVLRGEGRVSGGAGVLVASATELPPGSRAALILAPANPAVLGAANRALVRAGIPWRFGAPAPPGTLTDAGTIDGVRATRSYRLEPTNAAPADTLARVDGRPWSVAGTANGTRYVLVASPMEPEAIDLPIRAEFVPWLAAILGEHIAGADGRVVLAAPGAPVEPPAEADSLVGASLEPRVARAIPMDGLVAPERPGVYYFTRGMRRVGALVVNGEESESVLDRVEVKELAARVRGGRVRRVADLAAWQAAAFASEGARSLVSPVLVAVLLLLAAEAFAAAAGGRVGTA